MASTSNIVTLDDIDNFLHDPENIEITRNHTKLWMESGITLQLLLECFPCINIANGATKLRNIYPKCLTNYVPAGSEIGLIGREDVLKQVRDMLDGDKRVSLVSGLGGIGKTAIMQKICESILEDDNDENHVAWITCGDSLEDDLLLLRDSLGVIKDLSRKDAFDAVVAKLKVFEGTLYLFLDDMVRVPDREEFWILKALYPHVRIMITSRQIIRGIPNIDITELEEAEALNLFYGYYEYDDERTYKEDVRKIINSDSVKRHTLLMELLAKAANVSFDTLDIFRCSLEKEGFFNVSRHRFDTVHDENLTIEESVIKLYDISKLTSEQQRIMKLFSIFTPEKVVYGKVQEWADFNPDDEDGLVKRGWLVRVESGFIIHQIIRDSLKKQMEKQDEELKIEEYGDLLSKAADTDSYMARYLEYTKVRERLVLAEDIAGYLKTRTEGMSGKEEVPEGQEAFYIGAALFFHNMAGVFWAQGDYEKALSYYGKALAIKERVLGTEHPSTATTYNNMAGVFWAQGDYEKALDYYRKALSAFKKSLGENHKHTRAVQKAISRIEHILAKNVKE